MGDDGRVGSGGTRVVGYRDMVRSMVGTRGMGPGAVPALSPLGNKAFSRNLRNIPEL